MLRQHATGHYPLQHPYHTPHPQKRSDPDEQVVETPDGAHPSLLRHQFLVVVEGVRELQVPANTVWGEADCFIQYHFPTPTDRNDSAQIGQSVH